MELIGVYEASRLLNLTPPTVYALIKKGVLAAHRDVLTGRMYLAREEVEQLRLEKRLVRVTKVGTKGANANGTSSGT